VANASSLEIPSMKIALPHRCRPSFVKFYHDSFRRAGHDGQGWRSFCARLLHCTRGIADLTECALADRTYRAAI
jgi:hypothetical protein